MLLNMFVKVYLLLCKSRLPLGLWKRVDTHSPTEAAGKSDDLTNEATLPPRFTPSRISADESSSPRPPSFDADLLADVLYCYLLCSIPSGVDTMA